MQQTDKIDMDNGSFPLAKDVLRVLAKTDLASSYIGAFFVISGRTFGWHDPWFEKEQRVKKKKVEACIRSSYFEEFTGLPAAKGLTLTRGLGVWLRMGGKDRAEVVSVACKYRNECPQRCGCSQFIN